MWRASPVTKGKGWASLRPAPALYVGRHSNAALAAEQASSAKVQSAAAAEMAFEELHLCHPMVGALQEQGKQAAAFTSDLPMA